MRILLVVARVGWRAARKEWRVFQALRDSRPVPRDAIAELMPRLGDPEQCVAELRRRGLVSDGPGVYLTTAGWRLAAGRTAQ